MQKFILFSFSLILLFMSCKGPEQTETKVTKDQKLYAVPDYQAAYTKRIDLINTTLFLTPSWKEKEMKGLAEITCRQHFYPSDSITLNARDMSILNVALVNGNDKRILKYDYDKLLLTIRLPRIYYSSEEIKIAIDAAASQFYKDGKYFLEGKEFSRTELIEFYKDLVSRFEIISIEDPFAKEDWQGFQEIKKELTNTIIIGDDLTTTNIKRIKEAHSKNTCNGIIIRPNQIGTVSETIEVVRLAKSYDWKIIVSHGSGETMDTFIADLAVGIGADFIKSGSPSQPERMVKYSRLLEIENELEKKR